MKMNNTWRHIRRSPYQSLAAVITMFFTLFLTGLFLLASVSSDLVLRYFESKPQITVFFTDKATDADVDGLKTTLQGTGKVASMKYISKQDALKLYQQQNQKDPLLLEMVTADILPASLEVSATDPSYLAELAPTIKEAQGVEEVVYQKDVVDTLLLWTRAVRYVGLALVGILVVDSLLIIMTVIGMKIALKKDEIEILKLIGASPWYIRRPFVAEGGLYGVFGAFWAWAIIAGVVAWFRPVILSFLGIVPIIHEVFLSATSLPFLGSVFGFLGILTLVGFLLGSMGSMIALARYLKV